MNDLDKKLSLVTQGNQANLIYQNCVEFVKEMHEKELKKLKSSFRNGKTDLVTLSSGIAALCAFDDLLRDLEKRITIGNSASAQLRGERI